MKIPAAFKIKELFLLGFILVLISGVIISLAQSFLLPLSLFIFLPFLILALWMSFAYSRQEIRVNQTEKSSRIFLMFKIVVIFLMLMLSYFAFGQGLLLYQTGSYLQNQPVLTQFANMAQLFWAVKLTLFTWVIASCLMLAMSIFDKHSISDFFPKFIRHSRYALIVDSIVVSLFTITLMLLIALICVEISRTIVAFAGFAWPIFPEVTAFILVLTLFSAFHLFHIKNRMKQLAQKPISIGRLFMTQSFYLVSFLCVGQGIIAFFPQQLIMPFAKPMVNILPQLNYETTWLLITVSLAFISAPLIARLFMRILTHLTIGQSALVLTIPFLIAAVLIYPLGLTWTPEAYFVPIDIDNIVYQVGPAQMILILALGLICLCFMTSKSLQMAFVDIMPKHMGQRLRRLRSSLADQSLFLISAAGIYLFFANTGYYFIQTFFLVLITLTLLWVSLYLFYTLTNCYKKAG